MGSSASGMVKELPEANLGLLQILPEAEAEAELAHRRLAEIEAYYDTAPVGLCVLDTELRYVRINERLAEINGLPAEAHLGRSIREVFPNFAEQTEPLLREILETGEAIRNVEITVEIEDGADFESARVESWYPMKNADGCVFGINIVTEDVSARKRAEAERRQLLVALEDERHRLKAVLEQMPAGVILVEAPSGRSVLGNEECARIFRRPFVSVSGVKDYETLTLFRLNGDAIPPEEYPLARAVLRGETVTDEELAIQRGDGTRGVLSVNAAPICDGAGQTLAAVVAFFDITEHKRVEDELARLNAELEERVARRTEELDMVNQELHQEIAERQRLEGEIVDISERVQSRIGQDLHDDLGQQLSALGMMAGALERDLKREGHPKTESLTRLSKMLKHAVNTTRTLAKGLYPMELEKGGFIVAIEELVRGTQSLSGVECVLRERMTFPLGAQGAIHLYRIVQEALNNALKHAQPKRIVIDCSVVNGVPTLHVANDGLTFKMPQSRRGLGLHILEYRARLLGAEITIEPGTDGGCKLTCSLQQHGSRLPS